MLGFRIGFVLFPIIVVLGFVGLFGYRYLQAQKVSSVILEPKPTLVPPKQAITGVITLKNGQVTQRTRASEQFEDASTGDKIEQGESVATTVGAAILLFNPIGTAFLENHTELVAVNLVPAENIFFQKSGTVQYAQTSQYPISVRALSTLSEISGDATITIIDLVTTVRVTRGSAKLALVDNNNNTKTWKINEGKQATIDNELRVTVR